MFHHIVVYQDGEFCTILFFNPSDLFLHSAASRGFNCKNEVNHKNNTYDIQIHYSPFLIKRKNYTLDIRQST